MNTFRLEKTENRFQRPLCFDLYSNSKVTDNNNGLQNSLRTELTAIQKVCKKITSQNLEQIKAEQRGAQCLTKLQSLVNTNNHPHYNGRLISRPNMGEKHQEFSLPPCANSGSDESLYKNRKQSAYRCCKHRATTASLQHYKPPNEQRDTNRPKTINGHADSSRCDKTTNRRKGYMLPTTASLSRYDIRDMTSVPFRISLLPRRKNNKNQEETDMEIKEPERQRNYSYTYIPRKLRSRRQLEEASRLGQFMDDQPSTSGFQDIHKTKLTSVLITNKLLENRVKTFVREIETFNKSKMKTVDERVS
ncbi:hypothetical protein SNE40_004525 [Patella caerulea]|uniref:Uncharacterized protein n=1 Tax=Patella caerulea TaxID=87958 RepID=A0AAN8K5T6_PATCE